MVVVGGIAVGLAVYHAVRTFQAVRRERQISQEFPLPNLPENVSAEYRSALLSVAGTVQKVVLRYSDHPQAIAALALLHYLSHDSDGEIRCWQRCLIIDPKHPLACSRLVALFQQKGDFGEVATLMERAIAHDPKNPNYRGIRASALRHLDRPDEAKRLVEEQLRLTPGNAELFVVLGLVCQRLNEFQTALQALEAAYVLAPGRVDVLYSLANLCSRLGDSNRADFFRREFHRIKSQQLESESRMGMRHIIQDELFLPERLSEILRYAGEACLAHGDLELAEECFAKALERNSADQEALASLLLIQQAQGRWAEAEKLLRQFKEAAENRR